MKILMILLTLLVALLPAFSKQRGGYVVRKGRNSKRKGRRRRRRKVRYPANVNTLGDKLKLKEMIRDIHE